MIKNARTYLEKADVKVPGYEDKASFKVVQRVYEIDSKSSFN